MAVDPPPDRPPPNPAMTETEFRRWYWMKAELADFARTLEIPTSGSKPELADRIAAALGGRPLPKPAKRSSKSAPPLPEPLTDATVIPENQKSTQQVRGFFVERIGPSFHFDHHMRTFLAESPGKTLGDAVDHWYASRDQPTPETPEQLEYVRFTKAWHGKYPDGTNDECRAAWAWHRSLPVDQRPPI